MLYSVAKIAKANGLESIMDLNRILIIHAHMENVNVIGMTSGKYILKQAMELLNYRDNWIFPKPQYLTY